MAAARREAGGGSWWWGGDAGGEGLANGGFGEMYGNEVAALGGYELELEAAAGNVVEPREEELDANIVQLTMYPRTRLRWTAELHDKFVKAVDFLGGANPTPKGLRAVMRIPGLTLYHLKSHLQKYRHGTMGRKLMRKEFVPINFNYRPRERGGVPLLNLEAAGRRISNVSNVFGAMNGSNAMGAGMTYGNMHPLVEPRAAVENLDFPAKFGGLNANYHVGSSSASAVQMDEQFADARPSLLPLFPPIQNWSGLGNLQGGGTRAVAPLPPRPVEMASVDGYLNSLSYSSSEFGLAQGHGYPYGGGTNFGTFFDDVASFPKVDDTVHLTSMGALDPSAGFANYYYP